MDWLRGLAALAVALFHFTSSGVLAPEHPVAQFCYFGHQGVTTFFVISGFVIPFAMWSGGYTWASAGRFLAKRFIRIYPPYLVCLLVCALVVWLRHRTGIASPVTAGDVGWHFFYLNDLVGRPWIMDIFWTLGLEAQFYLLIALVFPLMRGPVWQVWLVGGAWWAVGYWLAFGAYPPAVKNIFTYAPYFLLGIALFRFHTRLDGPLRLAAHVLVCFWLAHLFTGTFVSVWASAPVLIILLWPNLRTAVGRFLGDISYSFYLWHMPIWELARALYPIPPGQPGASLVFVVVMLAVSIVGSWAMFNWVERPAMVWSKRISYRNRPFSSRETTPQPESAAAAM